MLLLIKYHYSQHISKAMDFDLQKYADCYAKNNPFPHIILHNFWNETILSEVAEECLVFRDWDHETSHKGSIRKKICSTLHMLPEKTSSLINYCNSSSFLQKIEIITGESGLIPDPYLYGGGVHSTYDKGYLKMHTDFNWHNHLRLYRRINLLIYLNKNWNDSWGGELRLARMKEKKLKFEKSISPKFNTTVIFTTTEHTFHGHPEPLALPAGRTRNSIAMYYYVAIKPTEMSKKPRTSTLYID